jgi:hypothetical protein
MLTFWRHRDGFSLHWGSSRLLFNYSRRAGHHLIQIGPAYYHSMGYWRCLCWDRPRGMGWSRAWFTDGRAEHAQKVKDAQGPA